MIVSAILKKFDQQSIALQTVENSVTFGDLLSSVRGLELDALAGIRVAISLSSVEEAVKAVALLDGTAAAIIFISHTLSPEVVSELAYTARADVILADWQRPGDAANPVATADNLPALVSNWQSAGLKRKAATKWIMATSGTTGRPRLVEHSLASLCRTTKLNSSREPVSWALFYDHARFAGMQVILQSLLSGARLVVPDQKMQLSEKIAFFSRANCTHASATPTLWRNIAMIPNAGSWNLRSITLGGEIADSHVLKLLAKLYPNARIAHIFASTEAGVGFSVADGKEGFPVQYLLDAPWGIDLKISEGRLFIRNSQVKGEYIGLDARFKDAENWVDTGDLVRTVGDRVHFVGRENGLINVGGNKVMPEVVEAALLAHPSVALAHVFPKSNPFSGNVVAAKVILRPTTLEAVTVKKSIFEHLFQCLEAFEIPASISIVDVIPTNSAGKVIRK